MDIYSEACESKVARDTASGLLPATFELVKMRYSSQRALIATREHSE